MSTTSNDGTWIEGGQRFRYEGRVIRTLATGKIKVAYGDDRLRELRAARESASASPNVSAPPWKQMLGGLFMARERALER